MARFAVAAADVAAAANTTAKSTRKRARCALRRFKRRRGRVREDRGEEQDAGGGKGHGEQSGKHTKLETKTAVENLAGEFHADNPAIFAFFYRPVVAGYARRGSGGPQRIATRGRLFDLVG